MRSVFYRVSSPTMKTFCIRTYRRNYMRNYRAQNLERCRQYEREYNKKNRARINARKKRMRLLHPERHRAYERDYRKRNPEKFKIYSLRQSRKNRHKPRVKFTPEELKERRREQWLIRAYGLTVASFDKLLNTQGNKCAICRETSLKWVVDHCHNNGKVRGILCPTCNMAIGLLKNSPSVAEQARIYLQ
jgi:hypothetical protein